MTQVRELEGATRESLLADYDVIVVGAGFAGMYALYRFRQLGVSVRVFEMGDGVGGTWYWNRYPGARVDVESMSYSMSFSKEMEQEWSWSNFYSSQPELLRYANHIADRFDLRRDIQFETAVVSCTYDEGSDRWRIETDHGDVVSARFLVTAVGCLSATNVPDFKGLESFEGEWYHTSRWPKEGVDLAGKRVAIIGTGSTGIQAIPVIAEQAAHLYVMQRTANYSLPSRNEPMDPEYEREWKAKYPEIREAARNSRAGAYVGTIPDRSALEVSEEERQQAYEEAWRLGAFRLLATFNDITVNMEANETAAEFVRNKIRSIVKDPKTAELLAPKDHPIGTKRICMDTGYYETFNRDNVTLVDLLADPIERVTPKGVQTRTRHVDLDVLVLATGFNSITGALYGANLRDGEGHHLRDHWARGPATYLGLTTHGFPNLFLLTGPGSPSVLANMFAGNEHHVDLVVDLLGHLRRKGFTTVEPTVEAQEAWMEVVAEAARPLLRNQVRNYMLHVNEDDGSKVFMPYSGGFDRYVTMCDEVVRDGYRGLAFS